MNVCTDGPKTLTTAIIIECKFRLLQAKAELLNRSRATKHALARLEFTGDEIDQTVAILAENSYVSEQERMRNQILEIEYALARIEHNAFGICEETDELIEVDRLLAIPWTRLSIEGAEIREAMQKKYARSV